MEHVVPARHDEATSNLVAAAGRARKFKHPFSSPRLAVQGTRKAPDSNRCGPWGRLRPVECRRRLRSASFIAADSGRLWVYRFDWAALPGARACRPRCLRIFSITGCQGQEALAHLQDRRNDLQLAAAVRGSAPGLSQSEASAKTNLYPSYVAAKDALEQLGPTQPRRTEVRAVRLALSRWRCLCALVRPLRHHHRCRLG